MKTGEISWQTLREDAIYEAIKDLECGDELRLQIINYTQLILENKQ